MIERERGVPRVAPVREPTEQESVGTLLSGLIGDLQNLIRGEVALAKTEMREELKTVQSGAVSLGVAAMVGLTGLIVLMLGISSFLTRWISQTQALVLVGAVLLVIAGIAGMMGKQRLGASSLKPDRTIESLKEDKEWASQQVSSLKN